MTLRFAALAAALRAPSRKALDPRLLFALAESLYGVAHRTEHEETLRGDHVEHGVAEIARGRIVHVIRQWRFATPLLADYTEYAVERTVGDKRSAILSAGRGAMGFTATLPAGRRPLAALVDLLKGAVATPDTQRRARKSPARKAAPRRQSPRRQLSRRA